MLVVLVLGVLAGFAIPSFSGTYRKLQLKKSADDLSFIMHYAQSRAITANLDLRLEFDPQFSSYWLLEKKNGEEPSDAYQRLKTRFGKVFRIPAEITVSSEDGVIDFFPDGTIEKQEVKFCQKDRCYIVSSKEQRGFVHVFEAP